MVLLVCQLGGVQCGTGCTMRYSMLSPTINLFFCIEFLTRDANVGTQSSDNSAKEIRESGGGLGANLRYMGYF